MKQKETELDAARSESVADIAGCLVRLSGASKFLSLPPRVALADIARVLADAFDEGKVLSPGDAPRRRHFLRTQHIDECDRQLYREVRWYSGLLLLSGSECRRDRRPVLLVTRHRAAGFSSGPT